MNKQISTTRTKPPAPLRFNVEVTEAEVDEYGTIVSPGSIHLDVEANPDLDSAMTDTTGAKDLLLARNSIKQLIATMPNYVSKSADGVNAAVALLRGINPQDELEGALAAQMVAVHSASIEMFRRAMVEGQDRDGVIEYINRAIKLTRTYATQMEALMKYRNRGGQQITVQHVQVNEGGQAVVGNVNQKGG